MKSPDFPALNFEIKSPDLSVLSFERMLRLMNTDGSNSGGAIVRYEGFDSSRGAMQCGVYLIIQDGVVVYCGKFTNTFARRWLYTRDQYIYHFKRDVIAEALADKRTLEVFAQDEQSLRKQLGHEDNCWISATSIEEKLIKDLKPTWNVLGRGRHQSSAILPPL